MTSAVTSRRPWPNSTDSPKISARLDDLKNALLSAARRRRDLDSARGQVEQSIRGIARNEQ